jgi:hypothetical protein
MEWIMFLHHIKTIKTNTWFQIVMLFILDHFPGNFNPRMDSLLLGQMDSIDISIGRAKAKLPRLKNPGSHT